MNVDVVVIRKQNLIVKLNSDYYRSAVIGPTDGLFYILCSCWLMLSPAVLDIGCVYHSEVVCCVRTGSEDEFYMKDGERRRTAASDTGDDG